jgi:predicted metal-binding membrane protein
VDGARALDCFLSVWLLTMAAKMFPSVSPTVALYSRMTSARYGLTSLVNTP